jgi:cobalt-zinc-cadmium resistance protein CzcA
MRTYIEYLLRWRVLALFFTGIVIVIGIISWVRLPIDAFPDVTNVQVMVLTEAPGLSTVDVEQQISYPIELQMAGIPKVLQVRSLSKAGFSQVIVAFEDNVDI